MRKLILLCLWCLVTPYIYCQDELDFPVNEQGKVEFSEVVDVEGVSASELRKRCKKWFAESYKSAKDVIQYDGEDNITGKGIFQMKVPSFGLEMDVPTTHTIIVDFKENKYRVRITDIDYGTAVVKNAEYVKSKADQVKAKGKEPKGDIKNYLITTNKYCKNTLESLKKAMKTKSEKDDW